jgi:menaquinol-cytochrome c reductase iron-sulfur subunit
MANRTRDRRRFLRLCTDVVLAVIGLLLAIPVFGYIGAPFLRRRGSGAAGTHDVDLGPLDDLPVGEWRLLSLEVVQENGWEKTQQPHGVWVRRDGHTDSEVTVLSPICPHLGCPINWHPNLKEFICPCHGGTFNENGQYISGPPPRSMDPLPFEIQNGQLRVKWEEFKIGVAQRIPVRP